MGRQYDLRAVRCVDAPAAIAPSASYKVRMRSSASTLVVSLLVALAGCGGSTNAATDAGGGGTNNPSCLEIMERCHPLDDGTGEIHECHEFSENVATSEADCVAMHDHCFAVCTADGGTTGDAGTVADAGATDDAGTADQDADVDAAHAH